jgi:MoaA/NifB/PqqE/SkfB family radical SAM enzyme
MNTDVLTLKLWFAKLAQIARYHFDSLKTRLTGRPEKVRWVTWEVTDACNSRCVLCDIWKTKRSDLVLTLEEVKKTFSDPLFRDLEGVLLTGGEPVLRSDLLEIILFIHQQIPRAKFTLSTNAILPDRVLEVVRAAATAGVCLDLGVSLDGIGEHHDRIRGIPGNFEKVDYLLKELVKLRAQYPNQLLIVAGLTLHPLTVEYVQEVEDYAKKMGVHFIVQLYDEAPYYHNVGKSAAAEKLDSDTIKMLREVERLQPSMHNSIVGKLLREKTIKFRCYAFSSFFLLRANGDMMPCLRMSSVKLGNVREATPSQIWFSAKAQEMRRTVRNCAGCGNTWATDWSMYNNVWPFLGLFPRFIVRRLLNK